MRYCLRTSATSIIAMCTAHRLLVVSAQLTADKVLNILRRLRCKASWPPVNQSIIIYLAHIHSKRKKINKVYIYVYKFVLNIIPRLYIHTCAQMYWLLHSDRCLEFRP